jgi:hypothetical protein
MRRRLLVALALAAGLLTVPSASVFAECTNPPIGATDHLDVAHASSATVTEASTAVDPTLPGLAPFDWHVELGVERIYRGHAPHRLAYNGWQVGCHLLRGDKLQAGDQIFVATQTLRVAQDGRDPFATGDVLVWKRTGDRWAFYSDALAYGFDERFYPAAARDATTTRQILRLVMAGSVPDTSAVPSGQRGDARVALSVLAFFLGLLQTLRRNSRANR